MTARRSPAGPCARPRTAPPRPREYGGPPHLEQRPRVLLRLQQAVHVVVAVRPELDRLAPPASPGPAPSSGTGPPPRPASSRRSCRPRPGPRPPCPGTPASGCAFRASTLETRSSPYPIAAPNSAGPQPRRLAPQLELAAHRRDHRRPESSSGSTSQPGSSAPYRRRVHAHPPTSDAAIRSPPTRHVTVGQPGQRRTSRRTVTVRTGVVTVHAYARTATLSDVNQEITRTDIRPPASSACSSPPPAGAPASPACSPPSNCAPGGCRSSRPAHIVAELAANAATARPRTRPGLPARPHRHRGALLRIEVTDTRGDRLPVDPAPRRRRVGPRAAPRRGARRPLGRHPGPRAAAKRCGPSLISHPDPAPPGRGCRTTRSATSRCGTTSKAFKTEGNNPTHPLQPPRHSHG